MFEQDYIVRQIRALTESLARALALAEGVDRERAQNDLDEAYRGLLPIERELFESLDARSLLPLLGEPPRVAALAELQALEGDLCRTQARTAAAARCYRRALAFFEHAARSIAVDEQRVAALRQALAEISSGEP